MSQVEHDVGDRVREYLATQDKQALSQLIESMPPRDALRELLMLGAEERNAILTLLPVELAASLIEEAPSELVADLVEPLEAEQAALIIETLGSDIQADVIGELSEEEAEAILAEMTVEDAADVRRLVEYEEDTAGGLMAAEAFTFRESETVSAVLRRLASEEEDFERYRGQHPYVLDGASRPVGVVSLRGLLTSRRTAPLTEIMSTPITVPVDATLDDLQALFDKHPFFGLPVVEHDGTLVGVVSRTAVDSAALEQAQAESLKRQGLVEDEIRSMPLSLRARRRLAWLSINIGLNIIAASVISAYEETLAAVIAIAVFLPMVSDMSGCSGNQAVAVSMRELSLGLVRPRDIAHVWLKEAALGCINGVVLGILIGTVAWLWKDNIWLGVVIGTALSLNTLLAVSIGGVVPLLLKRLGQDPAAASGPLLTTVTDMAGFFLVLSLATLLMPLLT